MKSGLMAIHGMIAGLAGGSYSSYADAKEFIRNPGIPPKLYGQNLAMRHKAKRHKPKHTGRRKK